VRARYRCRRVRLGGGKTITTAEAQTVLVVVLSNLLAEDVLAVRLGHAVRLDGQRFASGEGESVTLQGPECTKTTPPVGTGGVNACIADALLRQGTRPQAGVWSLLRRTLG